MRTYSGQVMSNGAAVVVVTIESMSRINYTLPHLLVHSTDFAWGYGGAGPADLALSILADFFGESPDRVIHYANVGNVAEPCPTCKGEGFITEEFYDSNTFPGEPLQRTYACQECENGVIYPRQSQAWVYHERFKWQFVATWPQDEPWKLTSTEIGAWLALGASQLPAPEVES